MCLALRRPGTGSLLLIPIIILWVISSGTLAIAGVLLGIVAAFFLVKEGGSIQPLLLVSVLALIASYFEMPMYVLPDYPEGAQLAPLSGILALPRPFFGPYYHVRTIVEPLYREALREHLFYSAFCFLILLVPVLFSPSRLKSYILPTLIALVALFFIGGELYFFNELREFGLFATVSRLVPGVALSGLPWIYFPMFALLFISHLPVADSKIPQAIVALLLGGLLFYRAGELTLDEESERYVLGTGEGSPQVSASKFVIDYWGDWVLDSSLVGERSFSNLKWLREAVDYHAVYRADPQTEDAWKAGDGNANTRWATKRPQSPGDYFEVEFDRPLEIIKVVLSIQGTPSDFPRGLRLELVNEQGESRVVFDRADWLGPVKWSPSGYPYFGPQSEVIIELPSTHEVRKLKFTQLAADPVYDWSIGELKVFSLK
jgi:hypothetical protein